MAIVVRIPTPLRAMTKGAAEVHAEASTIGDVITDLERQFPGLRDRIVEESDAETIRRIYQAFAAGKSPRAIARELNLQGAMTRILESYANQLDQWRSRFRERGGPMG